jgi:hypothetical protein
MHFGENQLSRSLIGLSPLPTGHPPGFQPWWVRASTRSYPRFTLPMGRSLRFGSTACDSNRPIRTRFRYGSPTRVNLATHHNSQAHSSKGTQSLHTQATKDPCNAPTACRHTVSGTISPPSPGCFSPFPHGTGPLSVIREYLGLPGGPGRFTRDFSGPVLLGVTLGIQLPYAYGGITLSAGPFQNPSTSATTTSVSPCRSGSSDQAAPQPRPRNACRLYHANRFSLFPFRSPLLRESLLFSLPAGTEMFHFPAFPHTALCVQTAATPHDGCQVTPFGNPRITVWLPTPQGISQAPTSFIGS